MSKVAEELISEVIERGEFRNLKGEGEPIDLDAYFATPAEFRLGYSVLKSNEFVPEEVERLREVGELREKLASSTDDAERSRLKKLLNEREFALTLLLERNKRRR